MEILAIRGVFEFADLMMSGSPIPQPPSPPRPPAAILGGQGARDAMVRFADQVRSRGFSVAGVVQQTDRDAAGHKTDMVLMDLVSGERRSFSQKLGSGSQSCTVDEQAVSAMAGAMEQALNTIPDLLVISKFGHLEEDGRGFRQEFANAVANQIPVLTTVHPDATESWLTFTGGRGIILDGSDETLWRWWGSEHLYADLAASVAEEAGLCQQVVIGPHWVMVEGPCGCGVSPWTSWTGVPHGESPDDRAQAAHARCAGQSLHDLARTFVSTDPLQAAIALAAINAAHNHPTSDLPELGTGSADTVQRTTPDCLRQQIAQWHDPNAAEETVNVASEDDWITRFAPTGSRICPAKPGDGKAAPWPLGWALSTAGLICLPALSLVQRTACSQLTKRGFDTWTILAGAAAPVCARLGSYGVNTLIGVWLPPSTATDCAALVRHPDSRDSAFMELGSLITVSAKSENA